MRAVFGMLLLLAQFTSYSKNHKNILEGNWQSCREADGSYTERVYDHLVNGVPKFDVHMGPKREFAIFESVQDEHCEHDSAANLLAPYRIEVEGNLASYEWRIPSLNLEFTVTPAGGSRSDCERLVRPPRASKQVVVLDFTPL
jgi:hypothetical protein